MTTFCNTFHNTASEIRAKVDEIVSATTYRKVRHNLCSQSDCQCGTFRGSRYFLRETDVSYQRRTGPREYMVIDSQNDGGL